ncbi:MAG: signal recognition particle-docking protein FtsY [Deltaproteobacteria bacterium]|jgi:fused signal recognition particle receptor|nr:signal recognition particle-docking protein FtsY [Deltaproteobacteria bacterium]
MDLNILNIISFVISVFASLIAIIAVARTREGSSINIKKQSQAFSEQAIKIEDLSSKQQTYIANFKQEIQKINERILKIEDYLLETSKAFNNANKFLVHQYKHIDSPDKCHFEVNIGQKDNQLEPDITQLSPQTAELDQAKQAPLGVGHGLKQTRDKLLSGLKLLWVRKQEINAEFYAKLEELLVTNDLGINVSNLLIKSIKDLASQDTNLTEDKLISILRTIIYNILDGSHSVDKLELALHDRKPVIILMVGVNGVGKTTTVAKFAARFKELGTKVLVVAADTFRAAAAEQLKIWGLRSAVDIIFDEQGRRPGAVVFDAIKKMQAENYNVMLIDTAGRLNNKTNLMSELESLGNLIRREYQEAILEVILVVDASTGQNALQQARDFNRAVNINSMVVTKLDGTYKGGIVVAIKNELDIPIRFIGIGEKLEDLKQFVVEEFVDALLNVNSDETGNYERPNEVIENNRRAIRRQRQEI